MEKASTITRNINIIRGQLEGVAKMINTKRDCIEVLAQLKAAKNGIDKICAIYAQDYLTDYLKGKKKPKNQELQSLFKNI